MREEKTTLRTTRTMTIVLAATATAAFLWVMAGALTPAAGVAVEHTSTFTAPATDWTAMPTTFAQGGDQGTNPDGDDRLPVQLWTLVAAGGAAGVGLLAFLLRLALGWVKPAPPQEESRH